ncbi:nucleoside-diphosphate sugar epimerase/dehydratase [Leifsonia sp. F6_8S_P_1B]|uniref:Nucleoside-diphosphate sugar epimerase/dehydratase n=1 Tax=Leifsonia williamsii TaxID=3035919 RepID=A0ABT8KI71_9MICO|nr:nucleoside-diphosphate sugar epimerase/dehydratase [Leifsonia williamsii]MDN4616157.1 nucleoside-diphosphate sugar epimerase/dehydratase [Leifsonia williamsii]
MTFKDRLWAKGVQDETRARGESLVARFGSQYLADSLAWVVAIFVAVIFRYDFNVTQIQILPVLVACVVVLLLQLVLGWLFWVYRGRYTYGSFEEATAVAVTVACVSVIITLPLAAFSPALHLPRSLALIAGPIAFGLMGLARYLKRQYVIRKLKVNADAGRAIIVGAGFMGSIMVRRMLTDPESAYLPVGFLDDDKGKRNLRLLGVPVLGTIQDMAAAAQATSATVAIVCVARADATLLKRISDLAEPLGLTVKVLPELDEVLGGKTRLSDMRTLSIEDLIGRRPVDTDVESIGGYLTGRKVLVTGAGGSIGSELCRQIAKYRPAELIMLDRDETGLQHAQLNIAGNGLLDSRDIVLADIRDAQALHDLFLERKPDVVFHAAALKHLPMLERYPGEAWKTNVLGTLNVLNAALASGVQQFINISTDKAARPSSILGHSKRVAERLTAWAGDTSGLAYLSVRFGNVLGSRGSLIPTFKRLIDEGKPLTVTHPQATRYFMTIPEACQLVMQAGAIGTAGEVLILDMGEPVSILDIAHRMIAQSGKDIEVVFTGLRPGEKLHEELIGEDEVDVRPRHPLISHARIRPLRPERLDRQEWERRWSEGHTDTNMVSVSQVREVAEARQLAESRHVTEGRRGGSAS